MTPLEPQGKPSNGPMSQLTNKRELRATREVLNTFARIVLIQQCLVFCLGPKNSLLLIRFCEFLRRFCLCERCVLDAPATKIAQVLYLQIKKLYIYIYILKSICFFISSPNMNSLQHPHCHAAKVWHTSCQKHSH